MQIRLFLDMMAPVSKTKEEFQVKISTNILGSYIMSFNTFYLEPFKKDNRIYSRIIDKHNEIIVSQKPMYVIRKSCLFLGTNYEATRSLSKQFFGNQHKLPIILTHDFGIPCIFIPIFSARSDLNAWIGLHAIEQAMPFQNGTKVILKNGEELMLSTQYGAFSKQFVNAFMLKKHFLKVRRALIEDSSF